MDRLMKAFQAAVGSGDLALEKGRTWVDGARKASARTYKDLAGRGEKVIARVGRAKPAQRVAEGTRQASRQLKGAATSIRKALGAEPAQKPARKAS
ncbi:MAG TPA: hypothetical protein VHL78_04440 [Actinomycetota bacterium]|nr:hypothetical protein [Actinomycetota bacterium]